MTLTTAEVRERVLLVAARLCALASVEEGLGADDVVRAAHQLEVFVGKSKARLRGVEIVANSPPARLNIARTIERARVFDRYLVSGASQVLQRDAGGASK